MVGLETAPPVRHLAEEGPAGVHAAHGPPATRLVVVAGGPVGREAVVVEPAPGAPPRPTETPLSVVTRRRVGTKTPQERVTAAVTPLLRSPVRVQVCHVWV